VRRLHVLSSSPIATAISKSIPHAGSGGGPVGFPSCTEPDTFGACTCLHSGPRHAAAFAGSAGPGVVITHTRVICCCSCILCVGCSSSNKADAVGPAPVLWCLAVTAELTELTHHSRQLLRCSEHATLATAGCGDRQGGPCLTVRGPSTCAHSSSGRRGGVLPCGSHILPHFGPDARPSPGTIPPCFGRCCHGCC
jgi:hypothetical protein